MPELETFADPPSWTNARGRIDRSACVEVRISEVRRLAGCVPSNEYQAMRGRTDADWKADGRLPLPGEKPARNGRGRIATGIFTITARQVSQLHEKRSPRQLAGDWRTSRARALRPDEKFLDPDHPHRQRIERNGPAAWGFDAMIDHNPNKGASRTKMIGLFEDWTQPLRIEKWEFEKRIQLAYYLVCPGLRPGEASRQQGNEASRGGGVDSSWSIVSGFGYQAGLCEPGPGRRGPASVKDFRLPPLSTALPGLGTKKTGCPQRVLKLLLVQSTAEECRDAYFAQTWMESLPPLAATRHLPSITSLLARYGPILEPRTLLCARCLGVAYGNHPETVRQGWRRRQGKANAEPERRGRKGRGKAKR